MPKGALSHFRSTVIPPQCHVPEVRSVRLALEREKLTGPLALMITRPEILEHGSKNVLSNNAATTSALGR